MQLKYSATDIDFLSHLNSQGAKAVFSISGSPLDIWFTASPNVKPQISDQFSAGLFKNFANDALESSVELFYKDNKNTMAGSATPGPRPSM